MVSASRCTLITFPGAARILAFALAFSIPGCVWLTACDDDDRRSGSTSTGPDPSPSEPEEPDPVRSIDLAPPLQLGMRIGNARPPLTANCQAHHYAERLSLRHLRLRCMTTATSDDPPRKRRFVEIGFLEYPDASPRLAYYVEEWHVPRHVAPVTFLAVLSRERHRLGEPQIALRPGRAAWQGRGRGGGNTTVELRQSVDGAKAVVSLAFRHTDLSTRLH